MYNTDRLHQSANRYNSNLQLLLYLFLQPNDDIKIYLGPNLFSF